MNCRSNFWYNLLGKKVSDEIQCKSILAGHRVRKKNSTDFMYTVIDNRLRTECYPSVMKPEEAQQLFENGSSVADSDQN